MIPSWCQAVKIYKLFRWKMYWAMTEREEEYNARTLYAMAGSKLNAIDIAYRKAGYRLIINIKECMSFMSYQVCQQKENLRQVTDF